MSWLLIALGAIASVVTKPKPYKPSAEYIRINKELEKQKYIILEPKIIDLRKKLPTSYTTYDERLKAINKWNDYYKKRNEYLNSKGYNMSTTSDLSIQMTCDGYDDVVTQLGIRSRYPNPKFANLLELKLPSDYSTEEERLQAIKAWNYYYKDYYRTHNKSTNVDLAVCMDYDGYGDVAVKLGIEWYKNYDWIK